MYINMIEILKEKMKNIRQELMSDNGNIITALSACDDVRDTVNDLWSQPGISNAERQELIRIDTEALYSWQCFSSLVF